MTNQEAIKILRTEHPGDSEAMELAKQMGAEALEKQKMVFICPRCAHCGHYIPGVTIKTVPEFSFKNLMPASSIDPSMCPNCHTVFTFVEVDTKKETCTLRGPEVPHFITKEEALERLTPKRPNERSDDFGDRSLCCPSCKMPVTNYWARGTYPKHCQFCGQALDWGAQLGADQVVRPFKVKEEPNDAT